MLKTKDEFHETNACIVCNINKEKLLKVQSLIYQA